MPAMEHLWQSHAREWQQCQLAMYQRAMESADVGFERSSNVLCSSISAPCTRVLVIAVDRLDVPDCRQQHRSRVLSGELEFVVALLIPAKTVFLGEDFDDGGVVVALSINQVNCA